MEFFYNVATVSFFCTLTFSAEKNKEFVTHESVVKEIVVVLGGGIFGLIVTKKPFSL